MRAEDVRPLTVGARAPAPLLETMDGAAAPLASYYEAGPTLLIFCRGSWCPFCQRHLQELARVEETVRAAGVRIVAISPDRPDEVAKHAAKSPEITYTLLSDSGARAARSIGD
jgi:peroxiredoxin